LWTCVRKSANTVGVVSSTLSNTLIKPALLGDEHPPVGRELHRGRLHEPAEDLPLGELGGPGGERERVVALERQPGRVEHAGAAALHPGGEVPVRDRAGW
jgi:hypothetical protein